MLLQHLVLLNATDTTDNDYPLREGYNNLIISLTMLYLQLLKRYMDKQQPFH